MKNPGMKKPGLMDVVMRRIFPTMSEDDRRIAYGIGSRFRWLPGSYNRTRGQGRGVLYALYPYLQEVYGDDIDGLMGSYRRHNTYFICRFQLAPFIAAILYHMEKEKAKGVEIADSSINDVKVSLMGPLSGIGDPLFQVVVPMIIAGSCLGLANQGSILGAILYALLTGISNWFFYIFFSYLGYQLGTNMIDKLVSGGLMDKVTKAASMLGVIMTGAICAQQMSINLNWTPSIGGITTNVQTDILDLIMPNLLPVVVIFSVFGLLKKKVSVMKIIIGIFVLNIAMALLGLY